jgi:hypothetical protein
VCVLAAWWSVCCDFGGCGAGAGFVDDGLAAGGIPLKVWRLD